MATDEYAILQRFNEARTPQELAVVLRDPSIDEASALAAHLGQEKFQRMRSLAFGLESQRGTGALLTGRNVVVIPGIMGSELAVGRGSEAFKLWLDLFRVARQGLDALSLDDAGTGPRVSGTVITASGLMSKYYGELGLTLGRSWNVRSFPYDWRSDLDIGAAALHRFIRQEFAGESVSIVAHSMGGLVARALWRMGLKASDGSSLIKRLIMLGTPNLGSFEVPLILTGIQDTVKKLIWLTHPLLSVFEREQSRKLMLSILSTFPAIYQMLPLRGVGTDVLATAGIYAAVNPSISQTYLNRGVSFLKSLNSAVDPEWMSYIAGYGFETIVGLDTGQPIDRLSSYWASNAGDGRVSHELGRLPNVPTFYVHAEHGALSADESVLSALEDLLVGGTTSKLRSSPPADRDLPTSVWRPRRSDSVEDLNFRLAASQWQERRLTLRGEQPLEVDPEAERLKDEILAGWVSDQRSNAIAAPSLSNPPGSMAYSSPPRRGASGKPLQLCIRLSGGNIAECHTVTPGPNIPEFDAIAVGVYENQRQLWSALRDLNRSMDNTSFAGLIADLFARGTVRGELAVPTLIPDVRQPDSSAGRDIVLVGMGPAGQFGMTETRQTAREIAWYLGRLGKRHLATILIGAGRGNLTVFDAMRETLTGLARALVDSQRDHADQGRLELVTFVEYFEDRIRDLHNALSRFCPEISQRVGIELIYDELPESKLHEYDEQGIERLCEQERRRVARRVYTGVELDSEDPGTVRINIEQVQDSFWFSALTETASIPLRQVEIDPLIVDQQNESLVAAATSADQDKAGLIQGRLLIPEDFRSLFTSAKPIVMAVDTKTARIHWELVVHGRSDIGPHDAGDPQYLSLNRRFTRQLRTRFAPSPEPLPAIGRVMKALIVADPAADAPLAGAQREGIEVAEIFKAYNHRSADGSRIDVTALIGPGVATRYRVLGELLVGQYDIVHYAGHCFFDPAAPQNCGWLFGLGATRSAYQVLAARELRRVDRLPRFIFSNACESGKMPIRPEDRDSSCAPAFAETFFERGVNNFVCTGWPVGDRAARLFARLFYGKMLGLDFDQSSETIVVQRSFSPTTMAEAMQCAREAVRASGGGLRTWGAYQHYGNPFTQFFIARREAGTNDRAGTSPSGGSPNSASPTFADPAPVGYIRPNDESTSGTVQLPTTDDDAISNAGGRPSLHPMFDKVSQIIDERKAEFSELPSVVDVRPGYHFADDWITDRPAVVVVVKDASQLQTTNIPTELNGVPIDVRLADPFEQVRSIPEFATAMAQIAPPDFLAPGETPLVEPIDRAVAAYRPPPGLNLDFVEETLNLICHASPDCGWPVLSEFLAGVTSSLQVAMYDFTAPHIRDGVRSAVRPARRTLQLVLDPALSLQDGGSGDNPKDEDVNEDEIVDYLRQAIGSRLDFAWAAVTRKGKVHDGIFPKAYHIKVAVRDKRAFWLSSGNWQSSNQPPLDVVPATPTSDLDFDAVLRKYNREWHLVVENTTLAKTFAKIVEWDLEQARPLQDSERGLAEEVWPDLLIPLEEDQEHSLAKSRPVPQLRLTRRIKIQPVLTPDNYPEVAAALIDSAQRSIRFQNQYINIAKTLPLGFDKLLRSLKSKCDDPKVVVHIILRKIGDVRKMLEALEAYGFDVKNTDLFRLQPNTHTKGIIVDDERVLVGSHNWSGPGTTRNRDASLLIDDAEAAMYFAKLFDEDWRRRAKAKVFSDRDMPRVASPTRDPTTPPGFNRLPWGAYFEDFDDI